MAKVLVTGGAGFIGAHLVQRLKKSHEVTVVDNLKTIGGIPYVPKDVRFMLRDICDPSLYSELSTESFDYVYHLAAQSAGESSYDNPQYDLLTNSYGTYLVSQFAKKTKVKNFIYTSTVAIYGNNASGEAIESMAAAPDSIYGVSKYSGELFVHQAFRGTPTQYSIYRLFNCYGPGENLNYLKKGMVSIFASYIWRGLPIQVKGSLDRYRDFTYIDDCIDILDGALTNENACGKTYNLSSGKKTIIRDLLLLMCNVAGVAVDYPVQVLGGTPGDTHGFHASILQLQRDFNWEPKVDLKRGLSIYFDWIRSVPVCEDISNYHPFQQLGG